MFSANKNEAVARKRENFAGFMTEIVPARRSDYNECTCQSSSMSSLHKNRTIQKKYKRFARKKAKGVTNITGEQRVAWVKEFMAKHKLEE